MATTFISRIKSLALNIDGKMISFKKTPACGILAVEDPILAEKLTKTNLFNDAKNGYWIDSAPPVNANKILRGERTGTTAVEVENQLLSVENEELKKRLEELESPKPRRKKNEETV